ncbi:MAG: ATP synthase F0 subunit B [Candidatus Magasanikbacteria bacterium RIFOXYD2_FULL_41_14]|uniref:ATP synthase subunit b n=1 Tax=Candidatus Magasanikbacteria bacterium RIFOXYD2_FULL_41_14 TaxID=1798709 RepID=A0A1F6PCC7_9BACT|nr:MAG: ATP synthase F0 subunit B [Candidatus Magasanikbacteria bacterium RIFOXYD2_FULL_41_14]
MKSFLNNMPNTNIETHTVVETENTDQGVLASLGLNGQLFTFQLINFAVVAVIIWFLILKPLTKKLAEREKMIDESIENSKKVQENLTKAERDYQKKIDDAKAAAGQILDNAAADGKKTGEQLKVQARKEIENLVDQAKRNIQIEEKEMVVKLKSETASLIVAALEKILEEKVDEKKDKQLIESAIKKLTP